MTFPQLSVVIVSYGTRELTLSAAESVRQRENEVPLEVIVVDNASTDGSADAVERSCPWVTLIRSPENGGFAKGANLGARVARGEWLLFLNSDARLSDGALTGLLREARAVGAPGALGPRIEGPTGVEHSVGRYYGFWRDCVRAFHLYRLFPGSMHFENVHLHRLPRCTTPVEWVSGACLLVRRDAFEEVGGFDEAYFLYVEDMDLCFRLARAGRTNLYVPGVIVHHEGARSPRPKRQIFIEGGNASEYFIKKAGMSYPVPLQRTLKVIMLSSWMAVLGTRLAWRLLRRKSTAASVEALGACWHSLVAVFRPRSPNFAGRPQDRS